MGARGGGRRSGRGKASQFVLLQSSRRQKDSSSREDLKGQRNPCNPENFHSRLGPEILTADACRAVCWSRSMPERLAWPRKTGNQQELISELALLAVFFNYFESL
jgi:hypothetical protein